MERLMDTLKMEEEKKRFEPYWRKCILVRCTT